MTPRSRVKIKSPRVDIQISYCYNTLLCFHICILKHENLLASAMSIPFAKNRVWRLPFRQRIFLVSCFVAAIVTTIVMTNVLNTFTRSTSVPNTFTPRSSTAGLNAHIWDGRCLKTIENLCKFPLFPKAPNRRQRVSYQLDVSRKEGNFGQRLFGFVEPPETGKYKFAIASDDSSELWLSSNHRWQNSKLIASVGTKKNEIAWISKRENFLKFPSQISAEVLLQQGRKYYVEVLHVDVGGENFIQVAWQSPMSPSFVTINERFLRPYVDDFSLNSIQPHGHRIPFSLTCRQIPRISKNKDFIYDNTPYLEHEAVQKALPTCEYEPSYLIKGRKLERWEAYSRNIIYTKAWPLPTIPGDVLAHYYPTTNFSLQHAEVTAIVSRYMSAVDKEYSG